MPLPSTIPIPVKKPISKTIPTGGASDLLNAGSSFTPAGLIGGAIQGIGSLFGPTDSAPSQAISGIDGYVNDRSIIKIAPVGVNTGAILDNYTNPINNGGAGLDTSWLSTMFGRTETPLTKVVQAERPNTFSVGGSVSTLAIIGAALVAGIVVFKR